MVSCIGAAILLLRLITCLLASMLCWQAKNLTVGLATHLSLLVPLNPLYLSCYGMFCLHAISAWLFNLDYKAMCLLGAQVDLTASSIRPAIGTAEMTVLQQRLIQKVSESNADITVHVSSWEHDTDQGALLPKDKVSMQVYSFADHRLAFYLDEINQLELLLKNCMLIQQGFKPAPVALAI